VVLRNAAEGGIAQCQTKNKGEFFPLVLEKIIKDDFFQHQIEKSAVPFGTALFSIWLPSSGAPQTIDIILPNTIHGCKRKNL
jgi:hypothetical protein